MVTLETICVRGDHHLATVTLHEALGHLCAVLEWAKGNRGSKHTNPYGVPEIEDALRFLAVLQDRRSWLDVDTNVYRQEV